LQGRAERSEALAPQAIFAAPGKNATGAAKIQVCGWPVSRILFRALQPFDDHSSGRIVTNTL